MILFTGKLNKSCMEKHTIIIGKVCRFCEKFAWYVLQGKSLHHLQINPTKHYHVSGNTICSVDLIQNVCIVMANQAISCSERIPIPKEF